VTAFVCVVRPRLCVRAYVCVRTRVCMREGGCTGACVSLRAPTNCLTLCHTRHDFWKKKLLNVKCVF
jgi:hypothetical protein